jgi:hypothetical protein
MAEVPAASGQLSEANLNVESMKTEEANLNLSEEK